MNMNKFIFFILLFGFSFGLYSQEDSSEELIPVITVGANFWSSGGNHFFEHCAAVACGGESWEESGYTIQGGDPTSRLNYDGYDFSSLEGEVEIQTGNLFINGYISSASSDGGTLRDQDWYNIEGYNSFYEISDTSSDLKGNKRSFTFASIGYDFNFGQVSAGPFLGMINYKETLHAHGLEELDSDYLRDAGLTPGPMEGIDPNEKVISNTAEWSGNIFGARIKLDLDQGIQFNALFGRGQVSIDNADSHLLRDDLGPSPNIKTTGDGDASILDLNLSYEFMENFLVKAGYRSWVLSDEDGTTRFGPDFANGYPEEISTESKGMYLGVSYRIPVAQ